MGRVVGSAVQTLRFAPRARRCCARARAAPLLLSVAQQDAKTPRTSITPHIISQANPFEGSLYDLNTTYVPPDLAGDLIVHEEALAPSAAAAADAVVPAIVVPGGAAAAAAAPAAAGAAARGAVPPVPVSTAAAPPLQFTGARVRSGA